MPRMTYKQQLRAFHRRRQSILKMLTEGRSQTEVAFKLGITRQRVSQLAAMARR